MRSELELTAAGSAGDGPVAAWAAIFEEAPAPLLAVTPDGTVVAANRAAAALFGLARDGLAGRDFGGLVERRERRGVRHELDLALASARSGQGAGSPARLIRTHGLRAGESTFPIEIRAAVSTAGAEAMLLLSVEDMTAHEQRVGQVEARSRWSQLVEEWGFEAVVVHQDGVVLHANRAATELLGYEAEEMVGQPVVRFTAPEDVARVERHLRSSDDSPYETSALARDGRRLQVEVRRRRITIAGRRAHVVSFHDLSGELQRRAALRASEERYRLLFERSMDGIFFTSPDGTIHDANPAACRMLGMTRDEICRVGRQPLQDESDPRWQDALRARGETSAFVGELRFRRRDGTTFPADVTSSVFVDHSGETRAGVIIRDVTARRDAEERVRAALRAEHRARRQVDELSTAKSEFLSTLSHEFRTGLSAIDWLMRPLTDVKATPAERAGLALRVHDEIGRLLRLVEESLELDRMESGRLTLRPGRVDLRELLLSLAATVRASGRRVTVRVPEGLPPVQGDRDRLSQVFGNLLGNATKFSPSDTPIGVGAAVHGGMVRAWVRNRGPAIPADQLEAIFERFTRVESGDGGAAPGAGLGLAIVRQLVELHGGRVWAASSAGAGTTIRVELPMARAVAQHRRRQGAA